MWLKLALGPLLLVQGYGVRRRALRLPEAAGPRAGVVGAGGAVGVANASDAGTAPGDQPPRWRVLVLGDSSAAGVGVAHQQGALAEPLAKALTQWLRAPVGWQLLATTGHTAADALAALQQVCRDGGLQRADLLVTALGVNDVVGQTPPRRWLATLDAIHALAMQHAGVRCTLHSGLPPMGRFPLLPQPLRSVLGRDARRLDLALRDHLADASGHSTSVCRLHVPVPGLPSETLGSAVAAQALDPAQGWVATDGFHPGPLGYRLWAATLAEAAAQRLQRERHGL